MRALYSALLPLGLAALLAGCDQAGESGQAASSTAPPAPATAPAQPFNTQATIRDVMNTLIDPHADALWQSVGFVISEAGIEEFWPQTEEEWLALRRSAISIIEGANALMIPGRSVAAPGASTEFPEYEYEPDEVQAKLDEDWTSWLGFAQGLQQVTLQALSEIDQRDTAGLSEVGGAIDQACEACHSQYWYRSF